MDHAGRIARLQQQLSDLDIGAFLVTDATNVRYLTGFSGSNGQVLVTPEDVTFYSDGRYRARAATLVQAADIGIYENRLTELLEPRLSRSKIDRMGFESGSMTVAERDDLKERLPGIELVPMSKAVEDMRRVKDTDELDRIREAVKVADEGFDWLLGRLEPGLSERRVALDLEVHLRTSGADEISFDPIVGSGPLSAHIHHTPSDRIFEKGDLVLLDFGARVEGYCSDLTRTVALGPATDEQQLIYALVLEAQAAGIAAIRSGVDCKEADRAARSVIDDAGRASEFGHGLGHGVGLDIHEDPRMNKIAEETLGAGEVVTVEPGVYVPERGGIRIEDCILVGEQEAEVLSSAPRNELIQL
jgi:Xaa-Pro aminopeptidase